MAEMTQMNVRIDRVLKERGDAALARAGYSSSQAVRKLWQFSADRLQNPQAIRDVLERADEGDAFAAFEGESKGAAWRRKASDAIADVYAAWGIPADSFSVDVSDEELREIALAERLLERGADA